MAARSLRYLTLPGLLAAGMAALIGMALLAGASPETVPAPSQYVTPPSGPAPFVFPSDFLLAIGLVIGAVVMVGLLIARSIRRRPPRGLSGERGRGEEGASNDPLLP